MAAGGMWPTLATATVEVSTCSDIQHARDAHM